VPLGGIASARIRCPQRRRVCRSDEVMIAKANALAAIPDELNPVEAAPLLCASDHWLLRSGAHRYSGPVTRLGRLLSSAAGIELAGNVERSFRPKSSAARGGKALRGKPRWRRHGHLTSTVTRIQG